MITIWRLECKYNDDVFYFSTKEKAEEWLARRAKAKMIGGLIGMKFVMTNEK